MSHVLMTAFEFSEYVELKKMREMLEAERNRLRAALLELGQAASVMNVMLALHEDYPGMVRGWKTAYRRYMRALRKAEKALDGEEE